MDVETAANPPELSVMLIAADRYASLGMTSVRLHEPSVRRTIDIVVAALELEPIKATPGDDA